MLGVRPAIKNVNKASRGYDKRMEILMVSKVELKGTVLSLCCGRGGWEQAIAGLPSVERIISVTFGRSAARMGHEDFTSKAFPGREKIHLVYGDARDYPQTKHDVLLFDGGESHHDAAVEERRFYDLFHATVMRQISPDTQNFVLKILCPTNRLMQEAMEQIQATTGRGALYRVSHSRASTLELYFVSLPIMDVRTSVRALLIAAFERGMLQQSLKPRVYDLGYKFYREEITEKPFPLLEKLDLSDSITELEPTIPDQGMEYNHWQTLGTYAVGSEGSRAMRYNKYATAVMRSLSGSLPGFDAWKTTDTTPGGVPTTLTVKI